MEVWAVAATFPDSSYAYIYVEVATGLLRKLAFKMPGSADWYSPIYTSYVDAKSPAGAKVLASAELWKGGEKISTFEWGTRERNPKFPEGVFEAPR